MSQLKFSLKIWNNISIGGEGLATPLFKSNIEKLFPGTSVIEYEAAHQQKTKSADKDTSADGREENMLLGLTAVVVASLCSAVAGKTYSYFV